MRVEFVNPFVDAASRVLEAEVSAKIVRGQLSICSSDLTSLPLTVLIAVAGEVQGIVLYSMSEETAVALASTMLGQPFASLDDLALSGIGELGNVITGTAATALAEAGLISTISPPTVISGQGIKISTLEIRRLVVPLRTQYGTIEVQVGLRENLGTDPRSRGSILHTTAHA